MSFLDTQEDLVDVTGFGAQAPSTEFTDVVKSEFKSQMLNYQSNSEQELRKKYLKERSDEFKKDTGEDLHSLADNFLKSNPEIMKRKGGYLSITVGEREAAIDKILEEYGELYGKKYSSSDDIKEKMIAEARESFQMAEKIKRGASGFDSTFGSIVGGLGAGAIDPVNIVTMPLGASTGMGLIKTVLAEAGANMVVEAALQPSIAEWQKKVGNEYGITEMVENVALAGLIGGAFGAAPKVFRSGVEFFGDMSDRLKKVGNIEASDAAKYVERKMHIEEADVSRLNDQVDYNKTRADFEEVETAFKEERSIDPERIYTTKEDIEAIDVSKNKSPAMQETIRRFKEPVTEAPIEKSTGSYDGRKDLFPEDPEPANLKRQLELEETNNSPQSVRQDKADFERIYSEEEGKADFQIVGDNEFDDMSARALLEEQKMDLDFLNTISSCGVNL